MMQHQAAYPLQDINLHCRKVENKQDTGNDNERQRTRV